MKKNWTFFSILRECRKKTDTWHIDANGAVRCASGLCPLGLLFTPRRKTPPGPDFVPVNSLVAYKVAYAADSGVSPDRDDMLRALGVR